MAIASKIQAPKKPVAPSLQYLQGEPAEERVPFLTEGFTGIVSLQGFRFGGLNPHSKTGFCVYIQMDAGEAGARTYRITGFASERSKPYALSDLRSLLDAICTAASPSDPIEWATRVVQSAMEVPGVAEHLEQDNVYMALATALDADCTPLVGIQLRVTDTRRVGQEGKTKIAATFAPAL